MPNVLHANRPYTLPILVDHPVGWEFNDNFTPIGATLEITKRSTGEKFVAQTPTELTVSGQIVTGELTPTTVGQGAIPYGDLDADTHDYKLDFDNLNGGIALRVQGTWKLNPETGLVIGDSGFVDKIEIVVPQSDTIEISNPVSTNGGGSGETNRLVQTVAADISFIGSPGNTSNLLNIRGLSAVSGDSSIDLSEDGGLDPNRIRVAPDGITTDKIADSQVTLPKLQQIPGQSLLINSNVATDAIATATYAQVKQELAIDQVDNTSDANKPISDAAQVVFGDHEARITVNDGKVSNVTHTGEVTGDTALTVQPSLITAKATEMPAAGDFILFSSTGNGGAFRKANFSDFGGGLSSVTSDSTLNGDGTGGSPLGIADDAVTNAMLAPGAIAIDGVTLNGDGVDTPLAVNTTALPQALGSWNKEALTTTPPNVSSFRIDNANPAIATELYLHETDLALVDRGIILNRALKPEMEIVFQQVGDKNKYFVAEIDSILDEGAWIRLGISNVEVQGVIDDNEAYLLLIYFDAVTTPGSGTVTSVGISVPTFMSVGNSPVTTAGVMPISFNSQAANTIFASPDGAAGSLIPRQMVVNDIPSLPISKITNLQSTLNTKPNISGTPADDQLAVWTSATDVEGSSTLLWSSGNFNLNPAGVAGIQLKGTTVLSRNGNITLANIQAIDPTTQATIQNAITALPNLTGFARLSSANTFQDGQIISLATGQATLDIFSGDLSAKVRLRPGNAAIDNRAFQVNADAGSLKIEAILDDLSTPVEKIRLGHQNKQIVLYVGTTINLDDSVADYTEKTATVILDKDDDGIYRRHKFKPLETLIVNDATDVDADTPLERQVLAYNSTTSKYENDYRVNHKGKWIKDTIAEIGDQYMQGGYVGIASVQTGDPVAPILLGNPEWVPYPNGLPPQFTQTSETGSILIAVVRVSGTTEDEVIYAVGHRIEEESGDYGYQLYAVADIDTNPYAIELAPKFIPSIGDTGTWREVSVGSGIVRQGTSFDIALVVSRETSTDDLTASWDYQTDFTITDPGTGEIRQGEFFGTTTVRVHYFDDGSNDRSAYLKDLTPQSTYTVDGEVFVIQSVSDNPGSQFVELTVNKTALATTGVKPFAFQKPASGTIPLYSDPGIFSGFPNVTSGFSVTDWQSVNPVGNDGYYGLRVYVQAVEFSPDWDIISHNGNGNKPADSSVDFDWRPLDQVSPIIVLTEGKDIRCSLDLVQNVVMNFNGTNGQATTHIVNNSGNPWTVTLNGRILTQQGETPPGSGGSYALAVGTGEQYIIILVIDSAGNPVWSIGQSQLFAT